MLCSSLPKMNRANALRKAYASWPQYWRTRYLSTVESKSELLAPDCPLRAGGQARGDTEGGRQEEAAGRAHGGRPDSADGGQAAAGAGAGADVPCGLVWIPAWQVGQGRGGPSQEALLPSEHPRCTEPCVCWTSISFCGRSESTSVSNSAASVPGNG